MKSEIQELLRSLPSVGAILAHEDVREWLHGLPRSFVVAAIQSAVDNLRQAILDGRVQHPVELEEILALAEEELAARSVPSLRRVVNATGIVLHTGLGRAPLCDAAIEAIAEAASGYSNLEYDLATGERGRRVDHIKRLLCNLSGAEAATVVNNNAAATYLILRVLAAGRDVLVSRGQLIEIGGSFRLPDIMSASGAVLREVGTTNRTRLCDYEKAISDRTALLLRVHTSNYRVVGFTEEVAIEDLSALAHRYGLMAVDDLGSGALVDPQRHGLPSEPFIKASVLAGADLICCSADKLLGGPQCGLIFGRCALIERLEADPMMRTYRVDKLTLLALEATLRQYLDEEEALQTVPTLKMLRSSTDELAERARKLLERLRKALPGENFYIGSDVTYAGGGSMPGHELETVVVQWRPAAASAQSMAAALRMAETPVIVRLRDDSICFDLRTVLESDFDEVVDGAYAAAHGEPADESAHETRVSLPIL